MKHSIEKLRLEYGNRPLLAVESDPLQQFHLWLDDAIACDVMEPNGMSLATLDGKQPTLRTVLLKQLDDKGFVFFTHYGSRKGQHLANQSKAALNFWWREIYRQVSVEGRVEKVTRKESVAYFSTRPKGAQLAAHASSQSKILQSRDLLEKEFAKLKKMHVGKSIPCPSSWGGYRLIPERIEFWQGRKNRLHDRFVYVKTSGKWSHNRLAP